MAEALAVRIGGEVEIVFDPDPLHRVRSPWRTFRHLLETTPAGATNRFQCQDDVIVCDGFRQAVLRAVQARPGRLLVFFVGGNPYQHSQAVLRACRRDEPWAELDHAHWVPVVATCWPVDLILRLTEFVDAQGWPPHFRSDDEIVGRFVREINHTPLATVPSLVEHPDVTPSLIGTRAKGGADTGRIAACFIGEGCGDCVETIDWTHGPG